jgi:poly(hydroxyalkanoate) depolymerase family esterase
MRNPSALLAVGALALAAACADLPAPQGSAPRAPRAQTAPGQWLSSTFSNAAGSRTYRLYVPTGYVAGTAVPLVVMLHGCTQDPDQFASGTEMTNLGEANTFLVAFPDEPSSANQNKCWNWFEPAHQARGAGEPSLIAGIVGKIEGEYTVDGARVYVAGISAGAAMAVIMGATYPDVFRAIGVESGLEYRAATSQTAAFTAMGSAGGPSPAAQGLAAYQAMGAQKQRVRAIVFHGTSDFTVYPLNGHQAARQWLQTLDYVDDGADNNSVDSIPDLTVNGQVAGGRAYTRYVYNDAAGQPVVEKWLVTSMGHAWSGGNTAGSFTDPQGPSATREMWRFFSAGSPGGGDTTPPVLTLSPAAGTYADSVRVSLSLNEAGTLWYTTDGSDPAVSGTRASLATTGTVKLVNTATLRAYGVDAAGNASAQQSRAYTITHPAGDTTPPTLAISPVGGSYSDSVRVTLSLNEAGTIWYTLDGSDPAVSGTRASLATSGTAKLTASATLRAYGVDAAGNASAQQSQAYTVTSTAPAQTATFVSIGTEDGYTQTATSTGTTGSTFSAASSVYVGENLDRADRGILSFDTSSLPDGAVITGVQVKLFYSQTPFGTPWTTLGTLVADVQNGCLGASCALAAADWEAAPSLAAAATFAAPSSSLIGTQVTGTFAGTGLAFVSLTGTTQLKLRFTINRDGDGGSDYVVFAGGDYTTTTYRPVLVVTYH